MQKWRLIALIVVMAAILVAGGLALLRFEAPRVTRANYRRIHVGMTRAEVEQILGLPTLSESDLWPPRNEDVVWQGRERWIFATFVYNDFRNEYVLREAEILYRSELERMLDPY